MPDIREEFEAWHLAEFGYIVKAEDDPNHDGQCAKRWKTWQASRAAQKVKLPDLRNPPRGGLGSHGRGFNDCLALVEEALQQAGIEVK